MGIDFNVFDDIIKDLDQKEATLEELDGNHQIPVHELFPEAFIKKYTSFNSFDELLQAGGFTLNESNPIEAIPEDALDKHILNNTQFQSWKDMSKKAASEYALRKLGF